MDSTVTRARLLSVVLTMCGIAAGTAADRPRPNPVPSLGGYRVVAADFHVHSATWSDGALTPWGLVLEARRQGLDAIAVTGHNQVSDAKVARWFSRQIGGPTVFVGQEVFAPGHHLIAVGIERVVDSSLDVAAELDEVHRQGGIGIAAHPLPEFWPAYDEAARRRLDGSEICHPLVYGSVEKQAALEAFAARAPVAAIGSSDYHGLGRMGMCRTYVFARDERPEDLLDAIRARRTVVYGPGGKAYGDPELIQLAEQRPELRDRATRDEPAGWLDWISRALGLAGLAGIVLTSSSRLSGTRPAP